MKDGRDEPAPFSIGHAARRVGVSVSTLRVWEEQGLLQPVKTPSGRRSYTEAAIARARHIRVLRQASGRSIEDIRRILEAEDAAARGLGPASESTGDPRFEKDPGTKAVGARVRALRRGAGMSLEALSLQTDIAPSHLSMFERGIAHLSPSRLASVAAVFGVSLAELLGGTTRCDGHVVRRGRGRIVGSYGPGVLIEQLTVAQHLMDVEIWTIDPGRGSDGFYAHRGEELIHVIEGTLEVELAGTPPDRLQPGDSAYFSSARQHRWVNPGPTRTVVLWVNTDTERLAAMTFERAGNRLALGPARTLGSGEGGLSVDLPGNAQTYRVIDTRSLGCPTRILIEPLSGLDGASVAEKAAAFRRLYDPLRHMLLHDPPGPSGSYGLIPTASQKADFGAFFVSSRGYPPMCGQALMGYAAALQALGRIGPRQQITVEVPAGVFRLDAGGSDGSVGLQLPGACVLSPALEVTANGRTGRACLAFGGELHVIVTAADFGLTLEHGPQRELVAAGEEILAHPSLVAARDALAGGRTLAAVLFVAPAGAVAERHFVTVEGAPADPSVGVTGLAARLAQRRRNGEIGVGETLIAEGLFGARLEGRVLEDVPSRDGAPPACTVVVAGRTQLCGVSTLIHHTDSPKGGRPVG